MGSTGQTVIRTEGATFESAVVFATGRHYRDCKFVGCTIVLHGMPFGFNECSFHSCIWRIEYTFHDAEHIRVFSELLGKIRESLTPPTAGGNGEPK